MMLDKSRSGILILRSSGNLLRPRAKMAFAAGRYLGSYGRERNVKARPGLGRSSNATIWGMSNPHAKSAEILNGRLKVQSLELICRQGRSEDLSRVRLSLQRGTIE
jgi:hypothetical protein